MKYFLALIFLISGCTEKIIESENKNVVMELDASSDTVFVNESITLYVDVKNNMIQDIKNVNVNVFSTGLFNKTTDCQKTPFDLKNGEANILNCSIKASELIHSDEIETIISAKMDFESNLRASQIIPIISKNEFEIRQKTGDLEKYPLSYKYQDSNIELTVKFSSELPFVSENTEFIHFKIKNIGNGFVENLELGNQFIFFENELIDDSCLNGIIEPLGKEFPTITCKINVPDINYLSNPALIIDINYHYEIRDSLTVKIIR